MTNRIEQIDDTTRNNELPHIARQARKHEKALEKLGQPFEDIGRKWLVFLEQKSSSAKPIREEWQKILPQITKVQEKDRPHLIKRLAKGLNLSEDDTNGPTDSILSFKYSLVSSQETSNGIRLSPESNYFVGAVSDLSGYYDREKAAFIDFINRKKDLRGTVTLPQIIPAVAQWFAQESKSRVSN